MSLLYWALLAAGIVATTVFLVLRATHGGKRSLYAKALASLLFIATAFAAAYENREFLSFAFWMLFGLICSMLGDIWLDLKWIYDKDKKHYLYTGFISFIVGHLCFISAIYTHYDFKIRDIIISLVASFVVASFALLIEKPLKMVYGSFKPILFLYTAILSM
ncbi:MAG: lysoplasmalogenase family protein, partial [Oscillospiraceae bacterium]